MTANGRNHRRALLSGTALTLALLAGAGGSAVFAPRAHAADFGSPGSPLPGDGIFASAYYSGDVTVTLPAGDRIFVTDDGIETHTVTGDITIDFGAEISAGDSGIEAFITGNGTIDIHVLNTGVITGTADDGIYARIDGIGDGGSDGIGDGNILIDHDGAIGSTSNPMDGYGIFAWISNSNSDGRIDIDVSGTICATLPGNFNGGIEARQDGKGSVSIIGPSDLCTAPSMDIDVDVDGDVYSVGDAVYTLTNSGNTSISVAAGSDIDAGDDGIEAHGDGSITIELGGVISAGDSGIEAMVAGSGSIDIHILPTASITGSAYNGIYALTYGIGDGGNDGIGDGNILIDHDGAIGSYADPVGGYGIFAWISNSQSNGNIVIDVTGSICAVKAGLGQGIQAINAGSGGITINAVTGNLCAQYGILAEETDPDSDADIEITSAGVFGSKEAIHAYNAGDGDISVSIVDDSNVFAGDIGIYAKSNGAGEVSVLLGDGVTIDPADFGIYAISPVGDVTIVTGVSTTITVDDTDYNNVATGIFAASGKPADTVDPTVEVFFGADNVVTINAALAPGKGDNAFGLVAVNYSNGGAGGVAVTAEDGLAMDVRGDVSAGIVAATRDVFGISTYVGNGNVSVATGDGSIIVRPGDGAPVGGLDGSYGILAASGGGAVSVVSELDIDVAAGTGIRAYSNAGNVTVVAGPISAGLNGIVATTGGSGTARVAALYAIDGGTIAGGAAITITGGTGTATADDGIGVGIFDAVDSQLGTGLRATSADGGVIKLTATGVLTGLGQGGVWVMELNGATGRTITIDNDGTIRSNGATPEDDLAIRGLVSGHVILNNSGTIRGRLDFSAIESATINNTGSLSWHTAGASKFTGGADALNNEASGLMATNSGGVATSFDFLGGSDVFMNAGVLAVGEGLQGAATLTLTGLESLQNSGIIVLGWDGASVANPMSDSVTNDHLVAAGTAFVGSGNSALRIDTFLGNPGISDTLTVGASGGVTNVFVKDTNASGPGAFNQILVVDGVTTTQGAFCLAGSNVTQGGNGNGNGNGKKNGCDPVQNGNGNGKGQTKKLDRINKGLVDYVLQRNGGDWFLVGVPTAGAGNMSNMSASWLDDWHNGGNNGNGNGNHFTNRALFGTQGLASDDGALWIRGLPSHQGPDELRSFTGVDGMEFGADIVTRSPEGSDVSFGLFGSYSAPRLEQHNDLATTQKQVWSFGAYLSNGAGFLDVTAKTDFMAGGFRLQDTPSFAAPLNGRSSGAQMNAGYRFGTADFYLEPLATLSYVDTEMNGVQLMGGSVSFDDVTSVRGRVAARLGGEVQFAGGTVLRPFVMAGVWQELGGSNDVTLHSGGTSFTLDGATRNTIAQFSGGVDLFARDGVSAYLKADYSTGGVFEQGALRAGVRWTLGGW